MIVKSYLFSQVMLVIFTFSLADTGYAGSYPLSAGVDVVGRVEEGVARAGETLIEIARRYDIGYQEIIHANPDIKPDKKMFVGTKVVIPSRFILPSAPREGLIINLSELRSYYYPKGKDVVVTHPVGIGRDGHWKTPLGITKITRKDKNPYWRPTANVRAEAAKYGTPIPSVFPPGPNNPLGEHSLRLGWPTYLIHGTNRPEGVGAQVSAGCIRMLPEDIEYLFDTISVGTKVTVIDEPYKVGWDGRELYFEAHQPLDDARLRFKNDLSEIVLLINQKSINERAIIQWTKVQRIVQAGTIDLEVIGAR